MSTSPKGQPVVRVRVFSTLRPFAEHLGLGHEFEWPVAETGTDGVALAADLALPGELIEGVFVNHTVHPLDWRIVPGDQVAFVPYGTPGPHRVYLGLYDAGAGGGAG